MTDPARSWPVEADTPMFFAVIESKEKPVPDTANHPPKIRQALAAVIDPARPSAASGAEVADSILDEFDVRPKGTVNPQEPGKVIGYNTAQPAGKVDAVNTTKSIENDLGRWLKQLQADVEDVDGRWVSIARTHFQQGFMALNRAVFQPESEL